MPDEMMAAQIIDPTIFTDSSWMYADVFTENDGHYGDTGFWDINWDQGDKASPRFGQNRPPVKAGKVLILKDLDKKRFKDLFVDLMTKPIRKPRRNS